MEAERISVQESNQKKSKEINKHPEKLNSKSGGRKNIIRKGRSKLMNPCVDWGFKYLFGKEESKSNLIGFLNLLLMPESPIEELEYMNNESLPDTPMIKECVFDILCTDANGDKYLVEMQNSQASNIRERMIYYTCRLVNQMGRRGDDWDYSDIKKVYSICLMNFKFGDSPKLRTDIMLLDRNTYNVFSDKLNIILLQLPCLEAQSIGECAEFYEKLLYLLNQMTTDMRTVEELKAEVAATQLPERTKEVFYQVLDTADVGSLSEQEQLVYESNLKAYRDTMSCIRFAEYTGREEGREEGLEIGRQEGRSQGLLEGASAKQLEIAKALKSKGVDLKTISECTGLSEDEIEKL